MLNKKNLIIVSSLFIFLLITIFVFFSYSNKDKSAKVELKPEENFFSDYSFEERENFIKEQLVKKFNIKEDSLSVFIGRESEKHINGLFFIENYKNKDFYNASFYVYIDNKLNIVWADEQEVDCSIIKKYEFSEEMAPFCF